MVGESVGMPVGLKVGAVEGLAVGLVVGVVVDLILQSSPCQPGQHLPLQSPTSPDTASQVITISAKNLQCSAELWSLHDAPQDGPNHPASHA